MSAETLQHFCVQKKNFMSRLMMVAWDCTQTFINGYDDLTGIGLMRLCMQHMKFPLACHGRCWRLSFWSREVSSARLGQIAT
jgi:hypothetical protein